MEGASSSKAGRKRYPDTESIQSQDSADAAGSPIGKRQRPNGEQSTAQSMSPWNIDALVSLQGDLKLKVLLSAGLSDKLQIAAGGFLNAAEAQQVSKQHGNDEQIAKLIEILKGKQDKDFITFRSMLQDTNNEVWAKELEKRAEEFKRENYPTTHLTVLDTTGTPETQGHGGTPQNAVQRTSALPESLHYLRKRAHTRYRNNPIVEGQQVQYTKVAVIENDPLKRTKGGPDQNDFLKHYRDCGIRLGATKEVTVKDFLRKGPQQNRIIYGQPGTGKTTFLKHLCKKVAEEEPSDFSLVLNFPLRDHTVSNAVMKDASEESLEELLQVFIPSKEKRSKAGEALLDSEGENVLIIFDGADEIRGLLKNRPSLLKSLLQGHLLPQAHCIVSTRPGGSPLLQEHCTLFYEMIGFDEEAVKSYVKDFFKDEPHKAKAMLTDLENRPDLKGGTYIPMNLQIFCAIYRYGAADSLVFPKTMTQCYKSFIARTIIREKKREEKNYQLDISLRNLPPDVEHLLKSLGDLAFNGLAKELPDYIFEENDVRRVFSCFPANQTLDESYFCGLLHLNTSDDGGYKILSTMNFSHTTKQEFFAAYHLSLWPEDEQAAFWMTNRHNYKFTIVLRCFAGLTQLKSAKVSQAILDTDSGLPASFNSQNPDLLYLFHVLFESQNESLTQSIVARLNSSLRFTLHLTPFDTMVLSHCLTKCNHLTQLKADIWGHAFCPTRFHHICSVMQCNPLLEVLALPVIRFTTEDARALHKAAQSLKKLTIITYGSGYFTTEALALLFDFRHLEDLHLVFHNDYEHEDDCSVLKNRVAHCHLRKLVLQARNCSIRPILDGVKDNCSITQLHVHDWSRSSRCDTASTVATCVQTMQQLSEVHGTMFNILPVLKALSCRDSPLDSILVDQPPWEEEKFASWEELEEAASCALVDKVVINVGSGVEADRPSRVLAAGFSKNSILSEVRLGMVPKESIESVRKTLCTDTALMVYVTDQSVLDTMYT